MTKDILPANTNQALAIIRLKQSENRDYIYQVLRSKRMQKYILDSISVGAQPNLNLEQMGNFSFYYPTLPEQQKIATFLSSVDEKLQGLKKKKSLLEAYKKGMMQRLFSSESGLTRLEDEQDLDDNNPTILTSRKLRFRQDNGEDFPEWEEKTLGEVCEKIQDGNYGGDYPKTSEFLHVGIPFITSKAIRYDGHIIKEKVDYISAEKHALLKKAHLQLNDVLFTNRDSNVILIQMLS